MYKRLFTNTLLIECVGSLLLASCFIMTLSLYLEQKGIASRIHVYITQQQQRIEQKALQEGIQSAATNIPHDTRGKLLYTLHNEKTDLSKIVRQVAILSFTSVPTIPLETVAVIAQTFMTHRKSKKKLPIRQSSKVGRYSSLQKAYRQESLQEYAIVENYLLYSLEKGDDRTADNSSIFAMRSYILKVNPRLSFQYADSVAKKIVEVSDKYNLPFILLGGLIGTESTYNKKAVSHVGAAGLTQVYPKVWKKTLIKKGLIKSVGDLYTIDKSIEAGAYILNSYYKLGQQMNHINPLRYALHRYYGARDNSYVERVYKHSQRIAQQISLLG